MLFAIARNILDESLMEQPGLFDNHCVKEETQAEPLMTSTANGCFIINLCFFYWLLAILANCWH